MTALIDWINTWAVWAGLGVLAYLAVSFTIALLIGRSFRVREQQVPRDTEERTNQ
ncbi:MAG TPA: hypothetical protein VIQ30_25815 [Pseudonocardia sp.]